MENLLNSENGQGENTLLNNYFEKYVIFLNDQVSNGKKKPGTAKQYKNKVKNFVEELSYKKVSEIDKDDIEIYVTEKKSGARNGIIYALIDFFKFVDSRTKISLDYENISSIKLTNIEDKRKPKLLVIEKIINIRKLVNNPGKHEYLYVFEMFFTYGLSLDQIVQCTEKNFDTDTKTFNIPGVREIKLNKTLIELVTNHPDLLNHDKRYWYQLKNKRIGEMVNPTGRVGS